MEQQELINLSTNHNHFIKGKVYIDIPYMIATLKAAPLTIGKGLIFNGDNGELTDFLYKWYSDNRMFDKLWQNEILCSLMGRSIMYLKITKTNDLSVAVATPAQNSRVAKVDEIEQIAELWSQPTSSDTPYVEKIQFFRKKIVITSYWTKQANGNNIAIGSTWDKVEDKLTPVQQTTYATGIDRLPVFEFLNKPYPALYGSSTIRAYPDVLPVRPMIQDIQDNIRYKRKEMRLNRTRFVGEMASDEMNKLNPGTVRELTDNDGYIQNKTMDYSDRNTSGGTGLAFADPKFDAYILNNDSSFDMVYKGCGYNWDSFNSVNYVNKTESLFANKQDQETTMIKQELRKQGIYTLLDYVLIHYKKWDGNGPRPYSIQFAQAGMIDKLKQDELLTSRLENGTISKVDAISLYDDVSNQQAQRQFDDINKELEEDIKATNELNKQLGFDSDAKGDTQINDSNDTIGGK